MFTLLQIEDRRDTTPASQ